MNNRTRGVFHLGGSAPSNGNNTLVYVTIQSTGNSVDFGDLAQGGDDGKRTLDGTFSNSIRGVLYDLVQVLKTIAFNTLQLPPLETL